MGSMCDGRCFYRHLGIQFVVRNEMMDLLSWRTAHVLTRVLFWCLFLSLLRNSGNKHQNNPLVSASIVRHSGTYIILHFTRNVFVLIQLMQTTADVRRMEIGLQTHDPVSICRWYSQV